MGRWRALPEARIPEFRVPELRVPDLDVALKRIKRRGEDASRSFSPLPRELAKPQPASLGQAKECETVGYVTFDCPPWRSDCKPKTIPIKRCKPKFEPPKYVPPIRREWVE